MRIYTRTGDNGETSLFDGSRVRKDDLRIVCVGGIDEFSALLGILRSNLKKDYIYDFIYNIQKDLIVISSIVVGKESDFGFDDKIKGFEDFIDELNSKMNPLNSFIIAGNSTVSAYCHLARTVCRRVERDLWNVNDVIAKYFNRLSDLLFVLARYIDEVVN